MLPICSPMPHSVETALHPHCMSVLFGRLAIISVASARAVCGGVATRLFPHLPFLQTTVHGRAQAKFNKFCSLTRLTFVIRLVPLRFSIGPVWMKWIAMQLSLIIFHPAALFIFRLSASLKYVL